MSTPISYNLRGASEASGLSQDTLKKAIHAGALRASKSDRDPETGEPRGRFVIKHADLTAWVDSLEAA